MNGIERLAEMVKGQKNKPLIKTVNYLMLQKDMEQYFLKEEKNLKDMAKYIRKQAMKDAIEGTWNWIDDEDVYQWAMEYFIKTNKELGIEKSNKEKVKNVGTKQSENKNEEFGSIFGEEDTKEESDVIEQISLF